MPFHGYPTNSRHYGIKPDAFQEHKTSECPGSNGRTYTDYLCCSIGDMRDKTHQDLPSPAAELAASGKHKDQKPELDPSKFKPILLFLTNLCWFPFPEACDVLLYYKRNK